MLKIVNNWEFLEYYFNGERIDPEAIKRVVFIKDGKTKIYKALIKKAAASYSDHGHVYNVDRTELYIEVPLIEMSNITGYLPIFEQPALFENIGLIEIELDNGDTKILIKD